MRNITIESLAKPDKYPIVFTFVFSLTLSVAANGLSTLLLETLGIWLETQFGLSKIFWQIALVSLLSIILFLLIYNIRPFLSKIFGGRTFTTEAPEELKPTFRGLIVLASLGKDMPAKVAIKHHWNNGNGNLEHCWIVCGGNEALTCAQNMVIELIDELNIPDRTFHFQPDYILIDPENPKHSFTLVPSLSEAHDPNVIRQIVEAIYKDAKDKFDVDELDIIADYTGGTKSMTTGLILACTVPSRRLQYILSEFIPPDHKPSNSKVMEIKLSYRLKPIKTD